MELRHIIVAADPSTEGQAALLAGARLARRCGSRVTAFTVLSDAGHEAAERCYEDLGRMVRSVVRSLPESPKVDLAVAIGVPAIEIGRFAETRRGDLLVIGRKHRSEQRRLMIGDTADAVVRRSSTPCLFVSGGEQKFDRLLAALDGSERGMAVLAAAASFARVLGACLRVVLVEPITQDEIGVPHVPTGRSERVLQMVRNMISSSDLGGGAWDRRDLGSGVGPLALRRGPVLSNVLGEAEMSGADILCIGYRRGGPAAVLDGGSIGRHLTHEAPCAILTVPL